MLNILHFKAAAGGISHFHLHIKVNSGLVQRKDRQNLRVWKVSARQMRCASPLFHTVLFIPLFAPRRPATGSALGSVMGWPDGATRWSKQQTAARCSSHPGPCAHQTRQECYLVWTKHPVRLVFPQQTCWLTATSPSPAPPPRWNTFACQILIICLFAEIPHSVWHCFQIGPTFQKRINTGSASVLGDVQSRLCRLAVFKGTVCEI